MRKIIISLIFLSSLIPWQVSAEDIQLQESAPDRYVVVPGDTLWGISGKFLKNPWKWPEIWRMNKAQIKNPHRIYPGDVIVLETIGGQPMLRVARETVKLNPQVWEEPSTRTSIPSIAPSSIEPFLSRPLVIKDKEMPGSGRIIASRDQRVVLGNGDVAYAEGMSEDKGTSWQIYRPGKALVDPDTREALGYEAIYLGEAKVLKFGETSTLEITRSTQEVNKGDRLVPSPAVAFNEYVPHAPDKSIKGRIISAYGSVAEVGQNGIVAINRGSQDGLENGHVLALHKNATAGGQKLPDERYGLLFVFRTFDRVSYALVMQALKPVNIQDVVQTP